MFSSWLFLSICLPLIHADCDYASEWFNENHPWDASTNGNDIERFPLIQAKYPWKFAYGQWTGEIRIRPATEQKPVSNTTELISKYVQIKDGLICHAVNQQRCTDFEIQFCLEKNLCGMSDYPPAVGRIVGGIEARPHSLPWVVSFQYQGRHICGGTLIDDRHVLTAAHCFGSSLFPIEYQIVLGAHKLSEANYTVRIEDFIFHPDYNEVTVENDVGVVKLNKPVSSFSSLVKPACLARWNTPSDGANSFLIAGWGKTRDEPSLDSVSDELRQASLISMNECSRIYEKFNSRQQICAGAPDFSKDSCQGDSGGGLFQQLDGAEGRWVVAGIVSYGLGCAKQGYPGIYARVSAYYDWIQATIAEMS